MEKGPSFGKGFRSMVAGAGLGLQVAAATAVGGILTTSNAADAQTVLDTKFDTYRDAREYASQNGYAIVNTGKNGTVFVSKQTLQQIAGNPEFKVTQSGTGINYIISKDPNTEVRVQDQFIIGGPNAKIDIKEEKEANRGDKEKDTDGGCDCPDGQVDVGGGQCV